jgi:hypothetical protein
MKACFMDLNLYLQQWIEVIENYMFRDFHIDDCSHSGLLECDTMSYRQIPTFEGTLKMEVTCFSETVISADKTIRYHNLETRI